MRSLEPLSKLVQLVGRTPTIRPIGSSVKGQRFRGARKANKKERYLIWANSELVCSRRRICTKSEMSKKLGNRIFFAPAIFNPLVMFVSAGVTQVTDRFWEKHAFSR